MVGQSVPCKARDSRWFQASSETLTTLEENSGERDSGSDPNLRSLWGNLEKVLKISGFLCPHPSNAGHSVHSVR